MKIVTLFLFLSSLILVPGFMTTADNSDSFSDAKQPPEIINQSQNPLPEDIEQKIQRIENGLLLPVAVKGQPNETMKIAGRMQFYKTPGVSIAFINNGRIEWARGYGSRETGKPEPVTPETLFQAGSISKSVTAIAALRLVEADKLNLDEDVNRKLISWKIPENEFTREKKVSVRGLLSHNAGVNVPSFTGYLSGEQAPTLVQVLDGVKPANSPAIRVEAVPGSQFNYSGGGYTIVQQLLIDVEKKTFPNLMRELVFEPLRMKHSTFEQPLPKNLAVLAASGHNGKGEIPPGRWRAFPEMAAAGLWTTPSDLARLVIAVEQAQAGRFNKFLSAAMVEQMLTPQKGDWGLGFSLENTGGNPPRFSHGGSTLEFNSYLTAYNQNGQGVVIMTNSLRGNALINEILRSIAREYGWKDFQQKEKTISKIDPRIYDDYAGQYQFEFSPEYTVVISTKNGNLVTELKQPTGQSSAELYPESETRFFRKDVDVEVSFVRDAEGHVTHLIFHQDGQELRAGKIK